MKSHLLCDSPTPPPGDLVKNPFLFSVLIGLLSASPSLAQDVAQGVPVMVVEEEAELSPDPTRQAGSLTVIPIPTDLPAGATLATLLEGVAGVQIHQLGGLGDFTTVSIRGSTPQQVAIYVDGAPLTQGGSSAVDLSRLAPSQFSSIELWRSGAPLGLGVAPLGGVINLVTRPEGGGGEVELGGGSFNTSYLNINLRKSLPSRAYMRTDLGFFQTEGDYFYYDDNATLYSTTDDSTHRRSNNDKLRGEGRIYLQQEGEVWKSSGWGRIHTSEEGIPGPGWNPTEFVRFAKQDAATQVSLGRGIEAGHVQFKLSQKGERNTLEDEAGELGFGDLHQRDFYTQSQVGVEGVRVVGSSSTVATAAQFTRDEHSRLDLKSGEEDPWVHRNSAVAGVEGTTSRGLSQLRLAAQLHGVDTRGLAGADGTTTDVLEDPETALHFVPTGYLGMVTRPNARWTVKEGIQRTFRSPEFVELFALQGATRGNLDLRPEKGWSGDLGTIYSRGETLNCALGLFVTHSEDLIIYVPNAQQQLLPVNFGRAATAGVEWSTWYNPSPQLTLAGAATGIVSRNLTEGDPNYGNELPHVPRMDATLDLRWSPREEVSLGYRFTYTSGTWRDATNWYLSAPRPLHSASLRMFPLLPLCSHPRCEELSLELDVRNLLNLRTEWAPLNPLDSSNTTEVIKPLEDFAGYPLPGRTWIVSVAWRPALRTTP